MTHDFAKPSTTKKPGASKPKKPAPGKPKRPQSKQAKKTSGASMAETAPVNTGKNRLAFYISLVLLVGAFAYGLYFLQSIPPTQAPETSSEKRSKTKTPASEQSTQTEAEPAKRFNFYDILPETTIKPPKVEEYRFKEKTGSDDFYYLIQTGSFKNRSDAERQKATIAFKGLKAKIETITNDQGTVWHRVKTGPYNDRSKLNSALDKLVSLNIQPLVKKVKKDS